MLFQVYYGVFPTVLYFAVVFLYAAGLLLAIFYSSEAAAFVGILLFSFLIRILYYVLTDFTVYPLGDPYGQFGVLRYFSSVSHAQIFPSISPYAFFNPLTGVANQYSQWPGVEILALTFSNFTGIPLLQSTMVLSFLFYFAWFVVAYVLVKNLLQGIHNSFRRGSLLSIAIAASLPSMEVPIVFKYDFLATIMLLCSFLLMITYLKSPVRRPGPVALMVLLGFGIVVTHSYTALIWLAVCALCALIIVVGPAVYSLVRQSAGSRLSYWRTIRTLVKFSCFLVALTVSWWIFYATFIINYARDAWSSIVSSVLTLSFQFVSPTVQSSLTRLTAPWIVAVLRSRNTLFTGLLLVGFLAIIVLPRILASVTISGVLLSVALISVATTLLAALSLNERSYLLFAPLLSTICILPMYLTQRYRPRPSMIAAGVICFVFLFSFGIGLWGASFAPTQIYSQGPRTSVTGDRPANWHQVAAFISENETSPKCVLSNELYVTSLSVPVSSWNGTNYIGNRVSQPGCISIIYSLQSTSTFGFSEPLYFYTGFSYSIFYQGLDRRDTVFSMNDAKIYFHQS